MEVEVDIKGKVVKSCVTTEEKLTIVFEDDTKVEVTLDSWNRSCRCHPEWEYYLDVALNGRSVI